MFLCFRRLVNRWLKPRKYSNLWRPHHQSQSQWRRSRRKRQRCNRTALSLRTRRIFWRKGLFQQWAGLWRRWRYLRHSRKWKRSLRLRRGARGASPAGVCWATATITRSTCRLWTTRKSLLLTTFPFIREGLVERVRCASVKHLKVPEIALESRFQCSWSGEFFGYFLDISWNSRKCTECRSRSLELCFGNTRAVFFFPLRRRGMLRWESVPFVYSNSLAS